MESIGGTRAPHGVSERERVLREIDGALALLQTGVARRVQLCGFQMSPGTAAIAEARVRADGLAMHIQIIGGYPGLLLEAADAIPSAPEDERARG